MKTELIFENGYARMHISPENEFEAKMLGCLAEKRLEASVYVERDVYRTVKEIELTVTECSAKDAGQVCKATL